MGDNGTGAEKLVAKLSRDQSDVFGMIAKKKPLEEIAERLGLSRRNIKHLVHSARFAFGATDDLVDDYLHMVETWEEVHGHKLLPDFDAETSLENTLILSDAAASKAEALDHIDATMSPVELRNLAASLTKLADALEGGSTQAKLRTEVSEPSSAAQIERNAPELARRAAALIERRALRARFLPADLFGEPAWNMLLDLFIQFANGTKLSGKSLSIAAGCPPTTALRHIHRLEDSHLLRREASPRDARVALFSLTDRGILSVGRVLEAIEV